MDDVTKEAGMMRQLEEIRVRFLRNTRGKLPLLLDLLGAIGAGDSTGLVELQSIAHRIHGSGATFNFPAISENAGQLENLVEALIGTPPDSIAEPEDLHDLMESGRRLVAEIGTATAFSPPTEPRVSGVANKQGIEPAI
jgi:HPt (histidine-containing phosphotransfer) domain-containing protein